MYRTEVHSLSVNFLIWHPWNFQNKVTEAWIGWSGSNLLLIHFTCTRQNVNWQNQNTSTGKQWRKEKESVVTFSFPTLSLMRVHTPTQATQLYRKLNGPGDKIILIARSVDIGSPAAYCCAIVIEASMDLISFETRSRLRWWWKDPCSKTCILAKMAITRFICWTQAEL